ncbi:hypothetical protein H4W33_010102 [Kibdelosporangium phytohabitans]|nr:hypothetical protein [Kibdelosporangium phytohabitans]
MSVHQWNWPFAVLRRISAAPRGFVGDAYPSL